MRWLRSNSGALTLLFTVVAALSGVWVKAALADVNTRMAVIEAKQQMLERNIGEIKDGVNKLVDRFIDKSWGPR